MKETLLIIIKDALDFDLELNKYEVSYHDDGAPFLWLDYVSSTVGRLRIGVTIGTDDIRIHIIPSLYNEEQSHIWDNPVSYMKLNHANIFLGDGCKMQAPDHCIGKKNFTIHSAPISLGEVLMNKYVIPGAIRRLIWKTEYGMGKFNEL